MVCFTKAKRAKDEMCLLNKKSELIKLKMSLLSTIYTDFRSIWTDGRNEGQELLMETLEEEIENVKHNQELILVGYLNGRTGKQQNSTLVGRYVDKIKENRVNIMEICETSTTSE